MNKLLPAALLITGTLLAAQQATFRAEINYVELPVRVLDAKGNFVRNLKPADFQIFEDGKPQQIASFGLIDLPAPVPARLAPGGAPAAAPAQVMNIDALQKLEGRLYLFIVDDYHIRSQYSSRAKQLVQTFIKDRMGANDAAALVFTSGIKSQDFTQSQAVLLAALDRFHGTFSSDQPGAELELKARSIVKTVTDFSTALGAIKGKHKAVIFVTPGVGCGMARQALAEADLMPDPGGRTDLASEGNGAAATGELPAVCRDEILNGVRAALHADVSVYSLDPRGAQNPGFVSPGIDGRGGPGAALQKAQAVEGFGLNLFDGMHILADDTGGFVVTGTNSFTKAFDRIIAESSSYYVIGYYASNDKADGTVRKNTISVDRSGLQVLYRAAYVAPRQ
jgi:VWFA-related protein